MKKILDFVRDESGTETLEWGLVCGLIVVGAITAIALIGPKVTQMWDDVNKLLPVEVTSAVPLDQATVRSIGDRIGEQTGNEIELTTVVDPDVLGGIVVAKKENDLFQRIRNIQYEGGAVPSPFDCWLILRGMRTLPWRTSKSRPDNISSIGVFGSKRWT